MEIIPFPTEKKKLVYCATPSRIASNKVAIMDFVTAHGVGPLHPFQALEYERFEGGPIGREASMEMCLRLINICNEFWMFGVSEGTLIELTHTLEHNYSCKIHSSLHLKYVWIEKPIHTFFEFDPSNQDYLNKLSIKFPIASAWLNTDRTNYSPQIITRLLTRSA